MKEDNFIELINNLKNELKKELPGKEYQYKMSSRIIKDIIPDDNTSDASVLILLYPFKNDIYTIFIKRTEYGGPHSGQVSFPGGRNESSDESLMHTAIRETNEEIGVLVKIIGSLTALYIPVSNYKVFPFVGYYKERPLFILDKNEVDYIIEVKIKNLLDPGIISVFPYKRGELKMIFPCYNVNSEIIWGATAMITCEFIEVVMRTGYIFK